MLGHGMRIAAAGGASALNYAAVVLADTPLAYWRLGETTGSTAADSGGNGYNGTYANCTLGAAPLVNNNGGNLAVSGNGSSSQILVGAVSALYSLSRNFSIEAWIKPASVAGGFLSGIFSLGLNGFCARQNGPSIELLRDYSVSLGAVNCGLTAGARFHIVVTVDSTGTATVYCNGVSKGTINASGYTYSGQYVRVGADGKDSTTVNTFLGGTLDEVAVYSHALTATQIAAHYSAGK